MSAASFFGLGGSVQYWVSGTTYAQGKTVRSPANHQLYVRIVAGAGTTDPASDTTNWRADGRLPIKYRASGVITITGYNYSATTTISSVDTGKVRLFYLGAEGLSYADYGGGISIFAVNHRIELTNATTITAYRSMANSITTKVGWAIEEDH
jgi:hypothetical protein